MQSLFCHYRLSSLPTSARYTFFFVKQSNESYTTCFTDHDEFDGQIPLPVYTEDTRIGVFILDNNKQCIMYSPCLRTPLHTPIKREKWLHITITTSSPITSSIPLSLAPSSTPQHTFTRHLSQLYQHRFPNQQKKWLWYWPLLMDRLPLLAFALMCTQVVTHNDANTAGLKHALVEASRGQLDDFFTLLMRCCHYRSEEQDQFTHPFWFCPVQEAANVAFDCEDGAAAILSTFCMFPDPRYVPFMVFGCLRDHGGHVYVMLLDRDWVEGKEKKQGYYPAVRLESVEPAEGVLSTYSRKRWMDVPREWMQRGDIHPYITALQNEYEHTYQDIYAMISPGVGPEDQVYHWIITQPNTNTIGVDCQAIMQYTYKASEIGINALPYTRLTQSQALSYFKSELDRLPLVAAPQASVGTSKLPKSTATLLEIPGLQLDSVLPKHVVVNDRNRLDYLQLSDQHFLARVTV